MALWLDLIPKLHKSDDLDSRFHQLENSSDRNSFEEDGTKDSVFQTEIIESSSSAPIGGLGSTTTNNVWSTSRRFTGAAAAVVRSRRTTPHAVVLPPSVESQTGAWVEPSAPRGGGGGGDSDLSNSSSLLSLRVTIGIGCALLVLNVLIFAGLCYQKDRVRRDMRMNTRFLDHLLRGKTAAAQDATTAGHPHDIYSVSPVASSDLNAAAAAADSNGGTSIPRRISVHRHHHHQPLQSTADNDDDDDDSFLQEATTKTSSLRRNSTLNRRSPPYAMVLASHCLVPPPPPTTMTTTAAANHVDCRDGGGLLLAYLSAEHGTLPDEHCSSSSNPSTVV